MVKLEHKNNYELGGHISCFPYLFQTQRDVDTLKVTVTVFLLTFNSQYSGSFLNEVWRNIVWQCGTLYLEKKTFIVICEDTI